MSEKANSNVAREELEQTQAVPNEGSDSSSEKPELTVVEGNVAKDASVGPVPGSIKRAQFAALDAGSVSAGQGSIDMLLDVSLDLVVELGHAAVPVREVLQFGAGSIICLDKLAGEPVDITVNGKLIARGEVVVVDENFGVRITEIASQSDRLKKIA